MRKQSFSYPNGFLSAKAAKVAELLRGQKGHWDFFDVLQKKHLYENRYIGSESLIIEVAEYLDYNKSQFRKYLNSQRIINLVWHDISTANKFNIHSIPTLIINNQHAVQGTSSLEELRQSIKIFQ